jgi:hypothetical protein
MNNGNLFEMYTNTKILKHVSKSDFWMKLGAQRARVLEFTYLDVLKQRPAPM